MTMRPRTSASGSGGATRIAGAEMLGRSKSGRPCLSFSVTVRAPCRRSSNELQPRPSFARARLASVCLFFDVSVILHLQKGVFRRALDRELLLAARDYSEAPVPMTNANKVLR